MDMEFNTKKLTTAQLALMDKNRQKALLLRESRIAGKLLILEPNKDEIRTIKIENNKLGSTKKIVDTGAGFFLEEDSSRPIKIRRLTKVDCIIGGDKLSCIDCGAKFLDSYLLATFDYAVCDKCKDIESKHCLITKTDAKAKYILSEVDLKQREPILKYISKKNPHNPRWGDMTLYLKLQVENRALEIHKSMDNIEKKIEQKLVKNEQSKSKKYEKKMKKLQREVRSSLYQKDNAVHVHEFEKEKCIDEDNDLWEKTCTLCGYTLEFEKM